jgi:hypothetical protein
MSSHPPTKVTPWSTPRANRDPLDKRSKLRKREDGSILERSDVHDCQKRFNNRMMADLPRAAVQSFHPTARAIAHNRPIGYSTSTAKTCDKRHTTICVGENIPSRMDTCNAITITHALLVYVTDRTRSSEQMTQQGGGTLCKVPIGM